MGLKFGSHLVPCSYLGGATDQTYFSFFFVPKMGPLQKIVAQIRGVFGFGGGYPVAPSDLPPPLGQILGTCLHYLPLISNNVVAAASKLLKHAYLFSFCLATAGMPGTVQNMGWAWSDLKGCAVSITILAD